MNSLLEFKAWLDGYTESMGGPPNAEQWKRIRDKLAGCEQPRGLMYGGVFDNQKMGAVPGLRNHIPTTT